MPSSVLRVLFDIKMTHLFFITMTVKANIKTTPKMLNNIKYFLSLLLLFGFSLTSFSQEKNEEGKKEKAPAYQLFRESENYSYLKEESTFEKVFWDPIKFIPFNASKNIYLTVGGEFRPRFEYFKNNN